MLARHRFLRSLGAASLALPLVLSLAACGDKNKDKDAKAADAKTAKDETEDKAEDKGDEGAPDEGAPAEDKAPEAGGGAAKFEIVELAREGDAKLHDLLAAQFVEATGKELRCFAEFRADWCGPCKKLEESMDDPCIQQAFAGVYLVRLEHGDWEDDAEGAGFAIDSIPAFFEIDESGKSTRMITGGAWGEDTPENMAKTLDEFFHAAGA